MGEPKVNVTVTLRRDLVNQVRDRVEDRHARSVSAFVQHAVQSQLAAEADGDGVVEEILATS